MNWTAAEYKGIGDGRCRWIAGCNRYNNNNKGRGEGLVQKKEDRYNTTLVSGVRDQQRGKLPRSFGPLVIKILCAAAQLGLGSSGDFNGTKKH